MSTSTLVVLLMPISFHTSARALSNMIFEGEGALYYLPPQDLKIRLVNILLRQNLKNQNNINLY